MDLITGGFSQGKKAFCKKQFGEAEIWEDFEKYVKESLTQGKDFKKIQDEVIERLKKSPDIKIISTETGCGIVPVEEFDRKWREVTGRLLCFLAEKAEGVYRVTCGIGVRIK